MGLGLPWNPAGAMREILRMDSTGVRDPESMENLGQGDESLASRIAELEVRLQSLEAKVARSPAQRIGYSLPESPPLDRAPWWRAALRGLAEIGKDLTLLPRVFTDPRYPLPWHFRVGVPALTICFFLSDYLMPLGLASIPVVGKVFDLALAGILFWLVWREVRRYRALSPDLPESWRA